jgi:hypothetical protein
MDCIYKSEIINYKIISDYEKLNSFIELLPNNNKDERYMLYLFARKKYNHVEGLIADKCQLKRIMCHKKDIVKSLEQLQIEEGKWTFDDIIIPQDNLVVYIQPNSRCLKKAARKTQSEIVDNLLGGGNLNVKSLFYNNLQKYASDKRFYLLDIDKKPDIEIDENELLDWLKLCIGFIPLIIKTKNGYHVLIETILLAESFKSKWFNNLNNNLPNSFERTLNGDNFCVIPGIIQANFEPYMI